MHIADVTLFFAPHSGGVKRYLLAKHRHYSQQTGVRHTLIVPGARDAEVADGIFEMKSPRIPYAGGYRFTGNRRRTTLMDVVALFEPAPGQRAKEPGEDTDIGRALQRVLLEIDEIAEATLRSISLETLLAHL